MREICVYCKNREHEIPLFSRDCECPCHGFNDLPSEEYQQQPERKGEEVQCR